MQIVANPIRFELGQELWPETPIEHVAVVDRP
jgi:hypothetical protein